MTVNYFQIGDRVEVVDYEIAERKATFLNQRGTVAGYDGKWIIVDHDEAFCTDLDSCSGVAKSERGWHYRPNELELITRIASTPVDDLL